VQAGLVVVAALKRCQLTLIFASKVLNNESVIADD
jgi:hypothetical protein